MNEWDKIDKVCPQHQEELLVPLEKLFKERDV